MNPWEIVLNVLGWIVICFIAGLAVLVLMGVWGSIRQWWKTRRGKGDSLKEYEEYRRVAREHAVLLYSTVPPSTAGAAIVAFVDGAVWARTHK